MMMKNFVILLLVWVFVSCENPYENVSEDKQYTGNPFVSLSSEQASVDMGINQNNNLSLQAGVFKDSIVLSHVLDTDLTVMLERVEDESFGEVGTHFDFQDILTIKSGENYGVFYVSGLSIAVDEISKYKLAVRIKEVDNENVIGGLYGVKKENEPREKRFKTYSFQKY